MSGTQAKHESNNANRAEIKDLIKSGKAFSFIGETISKAYKSDDDGDYYIEVVGSSDQEDLVGDVMTSKALEKMRTEFVGKTVFMNHRTNVPDDVFGAIVETELIKENGVQLLRFKILVEKENEAAMKTWRVINGGRTQLDMSVTVLVKDCKPNRKKAIIIDDVEAIELSVVGVPCNRESKTLAASASKALAVALASKEYSPEISDPSGETEDNLIEKGETEMKTEAEIVAETAAVEPEKTEIVVTGAGEASKYFARTIAAMAVAKSVRKQIASKAENIEGLPATVIAKGMFNDILAQAPQLWKLFDILCEVKLNLMSQKWNLEYLGQTDFSELIAAWDEALDEFKAAAVVSFKYWGDFDTEAGDEMVSNSLEIQKTFEGFSELFEKPPTKTCAAICAKLADRCSKSPNRWASRLNPRKLRTLKPNRHPS